MLSTKVKGESCAKTFRSDAKVLASKASFSKERSLGLKFKMRISNFYFPTKNGKLKKSTVEFGINWNFSARFQLNNSYIKTNLEALNIKTSRTRPHPMKRHHRRNVCDRPVWPGRFLDPSRCPGVHEGEPSGFGVPQRDLVVSRGDKSLFD